MRLITFPIMLTFVALIALPAIVYAFIRPRNADLIGLRIRFACRCIDSLFEFGEDI